jgi:hypothetical protein
MLVNGNELSTLNADNDVQCTGDKKLPLFPRFVRAKT